MYSSDPEVVNNIVKKVKVNNNLIKIVDSNWKEMYFILWKDGYMKGGQAGAGMVVGGTRFTEQYSIDSLKIQAIINNTESDEGANN